ncbi:MAG: DUF3800 domain-containing protein [Brumimicrobium sp.]
MKTKVPFELGGVRNMAKMLAPTADFDSVHTFYYDETNNIKKFYVKENDFNYSFTANFILGGLVHSGSAPDVQELIDSFKLQKTAKEVKFKHIASGNFLDCLKSQKLTLFLDYIKISDLYVHYSSLNILYWSIVDIVDSAIDSADLGSMDVGYVNRMKNDLYKLARLEIDSVIEVFYKFQYPNIKPESVVPFTEELASLFDKYISLEEYHFGLESLRQILKQAKKKASLPFIMDTEDFILINDLSHFYMKPIYLFKNSTHIFDNEVEISSILEEYKILDGSEEIKNYTFVDSQTNSLIQLSDVFVGIMGKLSNYVNTNSKEKISADLVLLNNTQKNNIDLLIGVIDKSHHKNIGLIHSVDCYEEISKIDKFREFIKANK